MVDRKTNQNWPNKSKTHGCFILIGQHPLVKSRNEQLPLMPNVDTVCENTFQEKIQKLPIMKKKTNKEQKKSHRNNHVSDTFIHWIRMKKLKLNFLFLNELNKKSRNNYPQPGR